MKKIYYLALLGSFVASYAQEQVNDTITYKKKVLETTEIDFLASYYTQDGVHSSVSGGIGSEDLQDIASNIIVSIPMNADDVLTFDVGISAYTSASSSNINPFNATGASSGVDDDDRYMDNNPTNSNPIGTPWNASSGASAQDALVSFVANYSHSNNDRNFVWNADVAFSNEYDYTSIGFGGGITKLWNQKNTSLSLKANVYLDQWRPIYPTELHEYEKYGNQFLNNGYFSGVTIYNENGPGQPETYLPTNFEALNKTNRNSYSASFIFSQIATKNMQFSLFFDLIMQEGLLSTPYHRIYFADKTNFYIGNTSYIASYETTPNQGVYRLADDIERLPNNRFKLPVGGRLNYYLNDFFTLRTYYRYYYDDWEITSHTASVELPIKLSEKHTVYPMYRYYTQQQSKYFAPFDTHLSTEEFYTSDYDLSSFNATQIGVGFSYTDIFTKFKIVNFGLKNFDFRINSYNRTDGLKAFIGSFSLKFVQ